MNRRRFLAAIPAIPAAALAVVTALSRRPWWESYSHRDPSATSGLDEWERAFEEMWRQSSRPEFRVVSQREYNWRKAKGFL